MKCILNITLCTNKKNICVYQGKRLEGEYPSKIPICFDQILNYFQKLGN